MERAHRFAFTGALTVASRLLVARDRLLRRVHPAIDPAAAQTILTRHAIASHGNRLDAVLVTPSAAAPRNVLLICHGIAETVDHWMAAQQLLATHGTASLVFDYSGYGRSTGRVDADQCERDAMAAFHHLHRLMPSCPIAMLGFSLGAGIAAAVAPQLRPSRLVLCAGFPSFRAAARALGVPAFLQPLVPPIWQAPDSLRDYPRPVLVVHGENDRLLPVRLAAELHACCGPHAELMILPGLSHTQPYYHPALSCWGPILAWLEAQPPGTSLNG